MAFGEIYKPENTTESKKTETGGPTINEKGEIIGADEGGALEENPDGILLGMKESLLTQKNSSEDKDDINEARKLLQQMKEYASRHGIAEIIDQKNAGGKIDLSEFFSKTEEAIGLREKDIMTKSEENAKPVSEEEGRQSRKNLWETLNKM